MELLYSVEMVFVQMLYTLLINNINLKRFVIITHRLIIMITELFCFKFRRQANT